MWAWDEDTQFDDGWGDDAESRSEFADDGWSGENGMLGAAVSFGEQLGSTGDDGFADEPVDATGFGDSGADPFDAPYGPDMEHFDHLDPDEAHEAVHALSGEWMHGNRDDWGEPLYAPDDADEDIALDPDIAEGIAGPGAVSWSKHAEDEWTDEQVDEMKSTFEGFRDAWLDEGRELGEERDPDDFGVPDEVLDDPLWEESNKDQLNYYDLKYDNREADELPDDEFYDLESGPFAADEARNRRADEFGAEDALEQWPMTQSEDLIAMQEELLELELENAQQADQMESDTLQHPEDTEADRLDEEDEHRHDTGPGTK